MKRFLLLIILLGSTLQAVSFKIHIASQERQPFVIGLPVLRQMAEAQSLSDSERLELLNVLATYDALDWSKALSSSRDTYNAIWAKADPINWEKLAKDYGTITKVRQRAPTSTGEAASSPTPTRAPAPAPTPLEEAFETLAKTPVPAGVRAHIWYNVRRLKPEFGRYIFNFFKKDLTSAELATIINALPPIIRQSITNLNVKLNRLTILPEAIGHLTALQELNVSYNQLTALPEAIGHLTALQELNVSHNQLTTLPDSIGHLTVLKNLTVDESVKLPTLRSEVRVTRVPAPTPTHMPEPRPTQAPAPAPQATASTTLEEALEQIAKTKAPAGVPKTTWDSVILSLRERNCEKIVLVSKNLTTPQLEIIINTLPKIIADQIENLSVQYNQLTALPDTIEKFTHLRNLIIYQNQLTELPLAIQKLTILETLSIDHSVRVPQLRPEVVIRRG